MTTHEAQHDAQPEAGGGRRIRVPLRFADLPIRAKLLLPFTILMLVWGIFSTFVLARSAASEARGSASAQLSQAMESVRGTFARAEEQMLATARQGAYTEGVAQAARSRDAATLAKLLTPVIVNANYRRLSVLDPSGSVVAAIDTASGKPHTTTGGVTRDPNLRAVAGTAGTAGNPYAGLADSSMVAAVPIRTNEGIVGSIVLSDPVSELITHAATDDRTSVSVYDATTQRRLGGDALPYVAPDTRTTYGSGGEQKREILSAALTVGGVEVATVVIGLAAHAATGWTGSPIAMLVAAVVLLVLGIGVAAARTVSAPIGRLVEATRALGRGDLTRRADVKGRDEVGRLGAAFNQMADELQASHAELEGKVVARTAELATANAELARVSQAKTDFLATMSHELRTPLNAVIGFADMLADPQLGNVAARERRSMATSILTSGRHLLTLINDLLDLATIEAGKITIEPEPLEMTAVAAEVRATMAPLAAARSITLTVVKVATGVKGKRMPTVTADRVRVRQILLNLVSNAVKYSFEGSRVAISIAAEHPYLRISVTDDGPGLTPEECEAIFEPFERVKAAATQVEGAGLGLALARQLVELHGGRLDVVSAPGQGSTFSFTLPLTDVVAAPAGPAERAAATA